MKLVLAYPPGFGNPKTLSDGLRRYFRSLISSHDLAESKALVGSFRAEEMVELAERIAQPNWESDIVFLAPSGPIFAYG